jgi:hypothetical protein
VAVRILRREHGLAVVEPPGEVPRGFVLAVKAPGKLCFLREGELERDIAVARLSNTMSIVSVDDIRFRALALRASLGVSFATFMRRQSEEGGAMDDVVAATIREDVVAFVEDTRAIAGNHPEVDAENIWLGWDGTVHVYAFGARAGTVDLPSTKASPDTSALAGVLAAMFREQRARELEWIEELFIEEITEAEPALDPGPTAMHLVATALTVDDGIGPPFLVTELVPCSVGVSLSRELGWLDGHARVAPTAAPLVNVSPIRAALMCALLERSRADNQWRLPTSAEFDRYARGGGLGVPSQHGVRGLCRVWEWTSTPHIRGGVTARGGRYRNRRELPVVDNAAWDDGPAADIGFRAVRFLRDVDAPEPDWEPRT